MVWHKPVYHMTTPRTSITIEDDLENLFKALSASQIRHESFHVAHMYLNKMTAEGEI